MHGHSTHTTDPNRKKSILHLTGSDTASSQQEKEEIPSYPVTSQPMRDCHNAANEKSLYFKLSVSSNRLFTTAIKEWPSPLLLWTYMWVTIKSHALNCNSVILE